MYNSIKSNTGCVIMSFDKIIEQTQSAISEVKTIEKVNDRRIEYCLGILHMLDAIVYGQPRSKLIMYQQELRMQLNLCSERSFKAILKNLNNDKAK